MNKDVLNDYPEYDVDRKCNGLGVWDFYEVSALRFSKKRTIMENNLKNICSDCKFLEKCSEWGIKYERYGFWGGLTESERQNIRKERGINVTLIR